MVWLELVLSVWWSFNVLQSTLVQNFVFLVRHDLFCVYLCIRTIFDAFVYPKTPVCQILDLLNDWVPPLSNNHRVKTVLILLKQSLQVIICKLLSEFLSRVFALHVAQCRKHTGWQVTCESTGYELIFHFHITLTLPCCFMQYVFYNYGTSDLLLIHL